MAVGAFLGGLDYAVATDQPYDAASSCQQQLTMDSHDLSGPLFLTQPTTTGASTYLHAAVTSPGLCNVNSSLQTAAGGSPEHRPIRSNDALHYISQMLMEDVDETTFGACQGEDALQAAEKPFRDILGPVYPPSTNWPQLHSNNETGNSDKSWTSRYKRLWSTSFGNDYSSYSMLQPITNPSTLSLQKRSLISVGPTSRSGFPALHHQRGVEEAMMVAPSIDKLVIYLENDILFVSKLTTKAKVGERSENTTFEVADPRDWDILEGRSNKHLAFTTCAIIRNDNFDQVLLCYGQKSFEKITRLRRGMVEEGNKNSLKSRSKGRQKLWQRKQPRRELVDLKTLLINCAQAVAEDNHLLASKLLKKIREHSSADGDCTQRLAFYLVDGLEARLAGIGGQVYCNLMERQTSTTDWFDAYSLFLASCPFDRTSYYFANQAILDISQRKPRVHIVDFGIGFGFQWPLMIQKFALQEEGAPKLRITGIDVPQPGFRPCEMIEETGKRLADYANMFKVPFQYQGIAASRWETIKIEDLNIDEGEVLIINCMFRMKNLGHETEAINSTRDKVLKTMRRMNPKIFISGTVNGLRSSPFFIQRFKEVMIHYSSMFDMLDANVVPRDNKARKTIERMIFGRDALNIIACEGAERTERPESYRQWHTRCLKAGFQQLPVDPDVLRIIVHMKNKFWHEEFFAVEDSGWLLQGWKGRVLYAISKWQPNESYDDQ
ncbi:scarecrow-like protein 9 [Hordeum vulgare subsp. vulgare]|uniref:Scarecrow-like protein 9 n=1 Tax=Hordeum vulgare subsp. vulgare TaxID=112509 RepID=A0A8I6WYY9_HORVV|nr:scarecrow-like protein 9 [Hordeum vulgare subsp. vulgare]